MTLTIWQLIDSRGFGGIETHIRILSESLNEHGYNSQIILTNDYGEHPIFDDSDLRSTVIRCRGLKDLSHRAYKERPAVIHGHGYKASLYAKLLGLLTQSHAVSTYHSGEMGVGTAAIYNIIDRFTARLSSGISVSDQIAETLSYSSTRIDNFIDEKSLCDVKSLAAISSTDKPIAFVGRMSLEKAPDRFAQLARRHPGQSFVMYGDGPLMPAIDAQKPANLTLKGSVDSMAPHWQDIGLLCICSREEGLPLVALEAMANGVPVVSVPVGGLKRLVTDNFNGFLLSKNHLNDLNDFISHWPRMPQTDKARVINAAYHHIREHYTSSALVPKIIEVYTQDDLGDLVIS